MKNKTFMRILASGMAAVMAAAALSAAACSDKTSEAGPTGEPKQTQSGQTDKATPKPAETDPGYEKSDLLPQICWIYGKDIHDIIAVDGPAYHQVECGHTQLFNKDRLRYVAVTSARLENAATPEDALSITIETLKTSIDAYAQIKDYVATTETVETINGIEVYKFVGSLTCYLDYYGDKDLIADRFAIGYGFTIGNTPCSIIGFVNTTEQSPEDIAEITAIVEAMIKTVREPKE